MKNFTGYIIPFLSIFFTFIVGVFSSRLSQKFEMRKHRYETFYVPLMQKWISEYSFVIDPTEIRQRDLEIFHTFYLPNAHLLGSKASKQLMEVSSILFEVEHLGTDIDRFNQAITELTKLTLIEAKGLAKTTRYPDLPGILLASYFE